MSANRPQLRSRMRSRKAIRPLHRFNRLTGFDRGSLDTTFSTDGKATIDWTGRQDLVHSVLIQPDGKIVLGGTGTNGSNKFNFLLARFNANGTLDGTFGTSGVVGTDFGASGDEPWGLAIQSNGKLVASGATNTGGKRFAYARYNTDGSLDTSFDGDGKLLVNITSSNDEQASAVLVRPTGEVVAGGWCYISGQLDWALVQLGLGTGSGGTSNERIYVLQDANENVTALVGTNGAVLQRYVEDSYGNQTVLTPAWAGTTDAYGLLYGHQGGRYDPATGLYHFRARDYDPKLGRWMQADKAYFDGASLYQYEQSGPVGQLDPSGMAVAIGKGILPLWLRQRQELQSRQWDWSNGQPHLMGGEWSMPSSSVPTSNAGQDFHDPGYYHNPSFIPGIGIPINKGWFGRYCYPDGSRVPDEWVSENDGSYYAISPLNGGTGYNNPNDTVSGRRYRSTRWCTGVDQWADTLR